jgi:hypothetical protein
MRRQVLALQTGLGLHNLGTKPWTAKSSPLTCTHSPAHTSLFQLPRGHLRVLGHLFLPVEETRQGYCLLPLLRQLPTGPALPSVQSQAEPQLQHFSSLFQGQSLSLSGWRAPYMLRP